MRRVIRLTVKDLRRILREEVLLEAENKATEESGEDSLDAQVDRYFSDYESEAKLVKNEGRDWNRTLRRLFEADEDEEEDKDEGEGDEGEDEEDKGEGEDEDDEEGEKKPPEGTLDDIDVASFANSVMRLVDNYDSLLEVRNTILRRASNFLNKNYKVEVIDEFNDYLSNEHGIEIGKSPEESRSEKFAAPFSDRAGGGGGGGGG